MTVFRAYHRYGVTTIRMVEKAGLSKSLLAIPYAQENYINDLLRFCIRTPYHRLGVALQDAFPRSACLRKLSRSKEELRRAAERRALRIIQENEHGMIGNPGIF